MRIKYLQSFAQPTDGFEKKITALAWSPNSKRLAACGLDRVVSLYDDAGERKDKFSTKPADPKGPKTYVVRGMAWSPDSTKLAVAQSDSIVFIYKLGLEWGDKKSICNKFVGTPGPAPPAGAPPGAVATAAAVTCVCWPHNLANEVIYGQSDGRVMVGQLKSNKAAKLYEHPDGSYVLSLAASPDGWGVIAGHLDGCIYLNYFDDGNGSSIKKRLAVHSCPPAALAWGATIVAAGSDGRVVFYDERSGGVTQVLEYGADGGPREFTCATSSPSGEAAVLGTHDRLLVLNHNGRKSLWEDSDSKDVPGLYTVSALSWRPDGTKVAVGALCGGVDVWDACLRRQTLRGRFELTYVSGSQVIIKKLAADERIVLRSNYGDITKVNVYPPRATLDGATPDEKYVVGHTQQTLLFGDMDSRKLSEIAWPGNREGIKFYFENEQVCMIYYAGELTLVEYGVNEPPPPVRTEYMSPHLISVRLTEGPPLPGGHGQRASTKRIAFLIDPKTIQVKDLGSKGSVMATIGHDSKVDWLELNQRGSHLLFRDKRHQLHLYNVALQERTTLLNYCDYVQWVPASEVVVAQNRDNLCVWYSISAPDTVTMQPIKGTLKDIVQSRGSTVAVVDEGIELVTYGLNQAAIESTMVMAEADALGSWESLEPERLDYVADMLEHYMSGDGGHGAAGRPLPTEIEALWHRLMGLGLSHGRLLLAERCAGALGDGARARFLHGVGELESKFGAGHYAVRAKLALLARQWKQAEAIYLEAGKADEAIGMYTDAHRWAEAIAVADAARHPAASELRAQRLRWLLKTGQQEAAGEVQESDGNLHAAISHYLEGGMPGRAALAVSRNASQFGGSQGAAVTDPILAALARAGLRKRAGELLAALGRPAEALAEFRAGCAWREALELARGHRDLEREVVAIEGDWGDWLQAQGQVDAAIAHFIEAGASTKAVTAALESRQLAAAGRILDSLPRDAAAPYWHQLARQHELARDHEEAERAYLRAQEYREAVEMHIRGGRWDLAHRVAVQYLSERDARDIYVNRGRELEAAGKLKDAERAYLAVKEADLAIAMYKKAHAHEHMVRLVAAYARDKLPATHEMLAHQLEAEGQLRAAEDHYLEANKDWKGAVKMYSKRAQWEDALRLARAHGGPPAARQVAFAWGTSLGAAKGAALLSKLGLLEAAIDYAVEAAAFPQAFELAEAGGGGLKAKLEDVHLKYAMFLEDDGKFEDAEAHFIAARKPREAVDMLLHQKAFAAALRVAEAHDAPSVPEVQLAWAKQQHADGALHDAEALYLKAKRPELALRMFREARAWDDARRIAEAYLPSKLHEVNIEASAAAAGGRPTPGSVGAVTGETLLARARAAEKARDYAGALEAYLGLTKDSLPDHDSLESAWESAAEIAMKHVRGRETEVVGIAASRLADIGRYEQAAELHLGLEGGYKAAVECYLAGGLWDDARRHAAGDPALLRRVEAAAIEGRTAARAGAASGAMAALEAAAAAGEWGKVHDTAAESGDAATQAKFVAMHAGRELAEGRPANAAGVLAARRAAPLAAHFALYESVARGVLSHPSLLDMPPESRAHAERDCRDFLEGLASDLRKMGAGAPGPPKAADAFERLLEVAHIAAMRSKCVAAELPAQAQRAACALLRYAGVFLPADKAFYEAGVACRDAGDAGGAFALLNAYIDIAEAVEEATDDGRRFSLDAKTFGGTGLPPEVTLPPAHCVGDAAREEARDWVLAGAMDRGVKGELGKRACGSCGAPGLFDGALACVAPGCAASKKALEICVVTGYPVTPPAEAVKCKTCVRAANRADWNKYVTKTHKCPWCNTTQQPVY